MNFSLRLTIAAIAVLIGISTLAAAATFARHRAQAAAITASR